MSGGGDLTAHDAPVLLGPGNLSGHQRGQPPHIYSGDTL